MSESEQNLLKDIVVGRALQDNEDTDMDYAGVINGDEPLAISNAGGELEALRPLGESGPIYQVGAGFYKL